MPHVVEDGELKSLGEAYDSSLKLLLVCSLELYLSLMLVLSFFESPDEDKRDTLELRYVYVMAWMPLICGACVVYGRQIFGKYGLALENFDRNVFVLKLLMFAVGFVELVIDEDMEIKHGPALQVAIVFCVCDVLRFYMEVSRLVYDDEEMEDEVDRLANMVIDALESNLDDEESAFKHAVHAVIEQNREPSPTPKEEIEPTSPQEEPALEPSSSRTVKFQELQNVSQDEHEKTTHYGTLETRTSL